MSLLASGAARAAECASPLGADQKLAATPERLVAAEAVAALYRQHGNHCLWSVGQGTTVANELAKVADEGLDPSAFHIGAITRFGNEGTPDALRDRDILLTDAVLRYAALMHDGDVDIAKIEEDTEFPKRPEVSLDAAVAAVAEGRETLSDLQPKQPEYGGLKAALERYRGIEEKGGWGALPGGTTLHPGDQSPSLPKLTDRLRMSGDLTGPVDDKNYTGAAVEAVRRFQARHGLASDGVVGPKTWAALNVPLKSRIETIELNLARWRSLSYAIPATRFEVNVPAASARLVVNNQTVLERKTVVGDPKHPTPMLMSAITDVILNPTWTVPVSIIENEIRPILKRDPGYLERNHMQWRDGNLVQDPGGTNSLGAIRFSFANKFGVYVHDTSAPALFASAERARSHGCMRLERPMDLAALLLANDPVWPRERLEQAIAEGKTMKIALPAPMPIVIAYWTAFTDPDGTVEFRNDVYGRDARLAAALQTARGGRGSGNSLDEKVYFAEGCGPSDN